MKEVEIYKNSDGSIQMEVRFKKDSVWLSLNEIANLFDRDKSVISRHISNIFKTKELIRSAVVAKNATTAVDGKTYIIEYYNLDAIISVGYRVNSQKATQFRIWATKILKDHLIKGYTVNEKLVLQQRNKLNELKNAIDFIESKSHQELLRDQSEELLSLVRQYTKSIDLLEQYDEGRVSKRKGTKPIYILNYDSVKKTIEDIKKNLSETKSNIGFFGVESSDKLRGIVGNLYQTYAKVELYKSVEEKAANLLYMIIKDHPFIDGNKRTGSLLFIYFLDKNNLLYRENGERKINDNALVALALLIAISNPAEKDVLISVVVGLLV